MWERLRQAPTCTPTNLHYIIIGSANGEPIHLGDDVFVYHVLVTQLLGRQLSKAPTDKKLVYMLCEISSASRCPVT